MRLDNLNYPRFNLRPSANSSMPRNPPTCNISKLKMPFVARQKSPKSWYWLWSWLNLLPFLDYLVTEKSSYSIMRFVTKPFGVLKLALRYPFEHFYRVTCGHMDRTIDLLKLTKIYHAKYLNLCKAGDHQSKPACSLIYEALGHPFLFGRLQCELS